MYIVTGFLLGTPGQLINDAVLDTGSSDLVVSKSTFNPKKSKSLKFTGVNADTGYYTTNTIKLQQVVDVVKTKDWSVGKLKFGYTSESYLDSYFGIVGVGYDTDEAFDKYENLPVRLKSTGVTHTNIYSIYGKGLSPSITFGGVDTSVYEAPLIKTPVALEMGPNATRKYYNVLAVTVNSAKLNGIIISNERLIYAIDSGSNVFASSQPIIDNICTLLGDFKVYNDTKYFLYSTVKANSLSFDITGFIISIPMLEIVDDIKVVDNKKYASLRMYPVEIGTDSYEGALPNAVLKYYYTVYDLEANSIFFAPYKKDPTLSSPRAILDANSYPIATQNAPNYEKTYTSFYQNKYETTIGTTTSASSSTKVCHSKRKV
ncbi:uncharacterized protein PRCAT00003251001 [Priceomyces carsonii]|uniref:uncharacterized protein n=1 Tax=Priceomyces carsonii TaxID=28549 RepID=UPI002EDB0EC5|nr:unnamed protein product [Priceomyces carsonii]